LNQVAEVEMTAKDFEKTSLLKGERELLRIEMVSRLPNGQQIEGVVWTDEKGETIKTSSQAMGLETYRVSKDEASAKSGEAELDLMATMMVRVAKRLPNSRKTTEVQYRAKLQDGDPSKTFVVGPSQAVRAVDDHTAVITVYAIEPNRAGGNRDAPADPPTDKDREPNHYIQSDDPVIVADAERAADGQTDPWRVALALERFVNREVKNKDYSQAFATASEVARSLEGDCTEHAVFLAALARARGIPARVVMGLVYLDDRQAFGYHMWNELYIGDRWIPLDGTLAGGGVAADHVKIASSNLHGATAFDAILPVVQILGQLRLEIVDVR
jgi:transglutaminase-like putative cysteine protease